MTSESADPWQLKGVLPGDWRNEAACRAAEFVSLFTVSTADLSRPQVEAATRVCRRCPVRMMCLQWALDTHQDVGVRGGLTEQERRLLFRRLT